VRKLRVHLVDRAGRHSLGPPSRRREGQRVLGAQPHPQPEKYADAPLAAPADETELLVLDEDERGHFVIGEGSAAHQAAVGIVEAVEQLAELAGRDVDEAREIGHARPPGATTRNDGASRCNAAKTAAINSRSSRAAAQTAQMPAIRSLCAAGTSTMATAGALAGKMLPQATHNVRAPSDASPRLGLRTIRQTATPSSGRGAGAYD